MKKGVNTEYQKGKLTVEHRTSFSAFVNLYEELMMGFAQYLMTARAKLTLEATFLNKP